MTPDTAGKSVTGAFRRRCAALEHKCPVCAAKPGEQCSNTIRPGDPLPGRDTHHARRLP